MCFKYPQIYHRLRSSGVFSTHVGINSGLYIVKEHGNYRRFSVTHLLFRRAEGNQPRREGRYKKSWRLQDGVPPASIESSFEFYPALLEIQCNCGVSSTGIPGRCLCDASRPHKSGTLRRMDVSEVRSALVLPDAHHLYGIIVPAQVERGWGLITSSTSRARWAR